MAGANIRGLMGKGVPPTPTFFSILRVAVMVLSLAVLAACAYNLSLLGGQASYAGPPGFMLFVSLFTLIILGGAMALERFAPQFYFRLALLIAYGVNVLFWLSGVMMIVVLFYFVKGCLADPDCYGISTGHGAEMGSLSLKAEGKQPSRSSNSE
ncbi:hypothetical protein K4K48_013051 [Colletotrichum sp. SAR 10_66]|nr:hypothetical protein K4K48_013051 [Colletotrichum sp. SAR 10_66]